MERVFRISAIALAAGAMLLDLVVAVLAARTSLAPGMVPSVTPGKLVTLAAIAAAVSATTVAMGLLRPAVFHWAAVAAALLNAPLIALASQLRMSPTPSGLAVVLSLGASTLAVARWARFLRPKSDAAPAPKIFVPRIADRAPGKPHPWRKRIGYPAFFVGMFVFFFYQTFPFDQIRARILGDLEKRTGVKIEAVVLEPAWLTGLHAEGVQVKVPTQPESTTLLLDEVNARLNILPLLVGRLTATFNAQFYGGEASGKIANLARDPQLTFDATGLKLESAGAIKQASGVDLGGLLDLHATLDLIRDKDQPKTTGEITLDVSGAELRGGQIMGMDLPRVVLGKLTGKVTFKDGEGTVERLSLVSAPDLDVSATGTVSVRQRLGTSPLNLSLDVRIADAFLDRMNLAVAKMVMAQARRPDGTYAYMLSGSLGNPGMPRPNLGAR